MNKIIHGDCILEINKMQKNSIDHLITDIPYYQIITNDWDNQWKSQKDYLQWMNEFFVSVNKVLKPDANLIVFTGRQLNRKIAILMDNLFIEKRIIIWGRKRNFNNTRGKALSSGYQPICYYSKSKNSVFNNLKIKSDSKRKEYTEGILSSGICLSDLWNDIPALSHNNKEKTSHPTQKPVVLMQRCILMCSNPEQTILDPFAGSGSTGVAAQITNRNCIMIQQSKQYYDIMQERFKDIK